MLAFVDQLNLESLVQEGHLLESGCEGFEVESRRFKDLRVRPESDGRTRLIGCFSLL